MRKFLEKIKTEFNKEDKNYFEMALLTITVAVGAFVYFYKHQSPIDCGLYMFLSFLWIVLFPVRKLCVQKMQKKQEQENETETN